MKTTSNIRARLQDVVVVIGMPRAGTTWLYENMKHHPDICTSDYKEINRYVRAVSDEEYMGYFSGCQGKLMLDISPLYYFDIRAIAEIAETHRFVVLVVRKPDEWIESLIAHIGKYDKRIDEMVAKQKYCIPVDRNQTITFDYAAYRHEKHLAEIRRIVSSTLLEIDFADLQRDPLAVLKTFERYLGIRDYFTAKNCELGKINTRDGTVSALYAFFLRQGVLLPIIRFVLWFVPRRAVHWLRRRFVYGQ